jgi:hypothetical protein
MLLVILLVLLFDRAASALTPCEIDLRARTLTRGTRAGCVRTAHRCSMFCVSAGINAAHWLAQSFTGNYVGESDTRFTAADFALAKSLGFNHVRLPVTDELLFNATNTTKPFISTYLPLIERQVAKILGSGLAVIFGTRHLSQPPLVIGLCHSVVSNVLC